MFVYLTVPRRECRTNNSVVVLLKTPSSSSPCRRTARHTVALVHSLSPSRLSCRTYLCYREDREQRTALFCAERSVLRPHYRTTTAHQYQPSTNTYQSARSRHLHTPCTQACYHSLGCLYRSYPVRPTGVSHIDWIYTLTARDPLRYPNKSTKIGWVFWPSCII